MLARIFRDKGGEEMSVVGELIVPAGKSEMGEMR